MNKHANFRHGFTLIELSIVILILSLLTASGLALGTKMVERAAYIDTRKLIDQLQETLKDYYIVNGRLPCVGKMTAEPSSSNFGAEVDCGSATTGTWRDGGVRIGAVPTRTLGLPDSAAADKFGGRIVYAVSEALTNTSTFGSGDGAIMVRDISNTVVLNNAAFFLASMGRDRKGAYIHSTGAAPHSCGSSANLDVLNCTMTNKTFRDAPFNNGDVAELFFDDIVAWAPKFHFMAFNTQSSALWASQVGTQHIFSVGVDGNVGNTNVGIGTSAPQTKLHVTGNSRVLRLQGSDHVYMEFYAGGALRSGYIGYPHSSSIDLTIGNEVSGGDINLMPNSGNVGIGTPTPSARLDVKGGYIRGQLECRQAAASVAHGLSAAHAFCAADEYVMAGGGQCGDETATHLSINRPWGNGWVAGCKHPAGGAAYFQTSSWAICCKL